jgi:hypothetical protein
MRFLIGILFSFLMLAPTFVYATETCAVPYQCSCEGKSYSAVDTAFGTQTDITKAQDACASACIKGKIETGTWDITCQARKVAQGDIANPNAAAPEEIDKVIVPNLSVPLPGLTFTPSVLIEGEFVSNYIGQYVDALYKLIIALASVGVVLTTMIAGMKWMMARGDAGTVKAAKESIGKAVTALFILLGVTALINIIDPKLSSLEGLRIPAIERIEIALSYGEEGSPSGSGGALAENCAEAVAEAKAKSPCKTGAEIGSPTGSLYSCNYHFRDGNYDYTKIKALDYPAGFGQPIRAPFNGTVSYVKGTGGDRCGNRIRLTGIGGNITMCHVQNFTGSSGEAIKDGTAVAKGQVIGHVGGACCAGEAPPSTWSQSKKCTVSGTPCTDPTKNESCQCQPYKQSGNTSGPHVHISFNSSSSPLSCVE